jgi:hypothetical protein
MESSERQSAPHKNSGSFFNDVDAERLEKKYSGGFRDESKVSA